MGRGRWAARQDGWCCSLGIVRGEVLKGPTAAFMEWAGRPLSSEGITAFYDGVIDGLVADETGGSVPVLQTGVLMNTPEARRRLAEQSLRFALELS